MLAKLIGREVHALDARVGILKDFLLDLHAQSIAYLLVRTGKSWLHHQDLLIAPEAIVSYHNDSGAIQLNLMRRQIEASPVLEDPSYFDRMYDALLRDHYNWTPYRPEPVGPTGSLHGDATTDGFRKLRDRPCSLEHLQRYSDLACMRIACTDGEKGHLEDFLFRPSSWMLSHLVIDLHNWLPSQWVLVDMSLLKRPALASDFIQLKLSLQELRHAPPLDESRLQDQSYQHAIEHHFLDLRSRHS